MATSKSNGVDSADWSRLPQESGPLWRRICRAIYNSEEKSFLGRTAKRWGKLFVNLYGYDMGQDEYLAEILQMLKVQCHCYYRQVSHLSEI